jgi:hypothetical protein
VKTNESAIDRAIRIVLGLVLAALIPLKIATGVAAIVVGVASGLAIVTGAVGFCAIYALVGISTCKVAAKN